MSIAKKIRILTSAILPMNTCSLFSQISYFRRCILLIDKYWPQKFEKNKYMTLRQSRITPIYRNYYFGAAKRYYFSDQKQNSECQYHNESKFQAFFNQKRQKIKEWYQGLQIWQQICLSSIFGVLVYIFYTLEPGSIKKFYNYLYKRLFPKRSRIRQIQEIFKEFQIKNETFLDFQEANPQLEDFFESLMTMKESRFNQIYSANNSQKYRNQKLFHNLMVAGIPGIGKTTTIQKLVKKYQSKQESKFMVFYYSLTGKDSGRQNSNKLQLKQRIVIQKLYKLQDLIYLISEYRQLTKRKNFVIIQNQKKEKRVLHPVLIVDDISKLEQVCSDKQNKFNMNQASQYLQLLAICQAQGINVITISSSTLIFDELQKNQSYTKGIVNTFRPVPMITNKTKSEINNAIISRVLKYRSYQTIDPKEISKFFTENNFSPIKTDDYIIAGYRMYLIFSKSTILQRYADIIKAAKNKLPFTNIKQSVYPKFEKKQSFQSYTETDWLKMCIQINLYQQIIRKFNPVTKYLQSYQLSNKISYELNKLLIKKLIDQSYQQQYLKNLNCIRFENQLKAQVNITVPEIMNIRQELNEMTYRYNLLAFCKKRTGLQKMILETVWNDLYANPKK